MKQKYIISLSKDGYDYAGYGITGNSEDDAFNKAAAYLKKINSEFVYTPEEIDEMYSLNKTDGETKSEWMEHHSFKPIGTGKNKIYIDSDTSYIDPVSDYATAWKRLDGDNGAELTIIPTGQSKTPKFKAAKLPSNAALNRNAFK